MQRKPILPMEIRTRWQRGFRRKSRSGQYVKVPILRIEIDFDPDQVMEQQGGAGKGLFSQEGLAPAFRELT